MSHFISINSYRRGTGKTMVAVNTAVLLTQAGFRVGLVDANFAAPGAHVLLQLPDEENPATLNDYIWGRCPLAHCVRPMLLPRPGVLYFMGASSQPREIGRILRGGYLLNLLSDSCQEFIETFELDYLVVDGPAGLNEEAQLLTAVSDTTLFVTRPDEQEFWGLSLLTTLAHQLAVPRLLMLVNQVPALYNNAELAAQFTQQYGCQQTFLLPHSPALLTLGSSGVFVLEYPHDAATAVLQEMAHIIQTNP
jgi:MinD-like ATPase involved in chromosome partitioning or flagellar assembly